MGFGGPHAAYMAVRDEYQRSLPGRLVGVSVDSAGRRALRLALQTREQHIRREKATSNICTSQVLLAVMASMYALYHGPDGLRRIGRRVSRLAAVLARGLSDAGISIVHEEFFDTICARVPGRADKIIAIALAEGINLRRVDVNTVAASLDQTTTATQIRTVWRAFGVEADVDSLDAMVADPRPEGYRRTTPALSHAIFSAYRSETDLVRYMRRLVNRDIALDRSMIPLGSCTMKLNAATEMEPVSWPEFANIHPFCSGRPNGRLPAHDRPARAVARRDNRVPSRLITTQQRRTGRACRPAGDSRLSPESGRRPAQHLPHPVIGSRYECGERSDGRDEGGGRKLRHERQRRC